MDALDQAIASYPHTSFTKWTINCIAVRFRALLRLSKKLRLKQEELVRKLGREVLTDGPN